MHFISDYTLILVSIQRGLPPIFHKNFQRINEHRMLPLILKTLGKTVKNLFKCVFKCISVVYRFSTMLLKKGCNTVDKVSLMPVEMWKTKYSLVVQILYEKLYRMPWRLGVEKHHICSDVREQSITLSPLNVKTFLNIYIPLFLFPQYNFVYTHTCGKVSQTVTALSDTNWCLWKTNKLEPQFRFNYC